MRMADSRRLVHDVDVEKASNQLSSQARYHRRRRRGLVMVHPVVDPQEVCELIRACGFTPVDDHPGTLAAGLEAILEGFSSGRLSIASEPD